MFDDGFLGSFWPPLLWEVVTFSFFIFFWRLLVCQMCQEQGSSLATFVSPIFHVHGKEKTLFICFIRISPARTPHYSLHAYGPPPTRWQIFVTFVSNKIPVWLIQKIFLNKNMSQVCHISRKKILKLPKFKK